MGSDDSDFAPPDEIREPDWSTDTTSTDSGSTDDSDDDSAFRMPPEIREPNWDE